MKRLDYHCTQADQGLEVLTLLRREFHLSTHLLRRLKAAPDGITLDGNPVTVRRRVTAGQRLSILLEPDSGRIRRVEPVSGPLDIIYEDNDLLILNKPAGLAVHPSPGHYDGDTLGNRVVCYLSHQTEQPVFRAINRLDRGTCGLMACAKHPLAAQRLEKQLTAGRLTRIYRAVAEGTGLSPTGMISLPIGLAEETGIRRCVRPDGQLAVTRFWVEEEASNRTLLRLELETGRTHQIRVHLSHLGYPLCGDFLYGTELPDLPGFALCSCQLSLTQPFTGATLTFSLPLPPFFAQLMKGEFSL